MSKDPVPQTKNGDPDDFLFEQAKHAVPGVDGDSSIDKLNELLFYIDMIKNSQTIKTGEYEAITRLYTGQKMYVDTRDVSEAPHLMFNGIREENVTLAFRDLWRPCMVFIDVGANFGYFPLLAGTNIDKKDVQLHLFEANPDLCPLLEKTMSVNGLTPASTVVNKAAADKPGKLTLRRLKNLWGGSTTIDPRRHASYRPIEDEFDAEYEVEAITLDSYAKEAGLKRVDLVKIDVEGAEESVYNGMKEIIKNNPDLQVLLEFTLGAYDDDEAFAKRIRSDFKFMYAIDDDGQPVPAETLKDLKTVAQSEWVMVLLTNNEPQPSSD